MHDMQNHVKNIFLIWILFNLTALCFLKNGSRFYFSSGNSWQFFCIIFPKRSGPFSDSSVIGQADREESASVGYHHGSLLFRPVSLIIF